VSGAITLVKVRPTHNNQIKEMPQAALFIKSVMCFEDVSKFDIYIDRF